MNRNYKQKRILMLLENEGFPEDCRVALEAQALVAEGYAVTVICPTGDETKLVDEHESVRVFRYPKPPMLGGFLGYLLEYGYSITMQFCISFWVLLRHGFDVIHVHTPPDMCALTAIFFKFFGKRFVFDLHDLSPELYQAQRNGDGNALVFNTLARFERLACRKADRLIATNETQRRIQIDRCGAKLEHCYVVRNGPNELFLEHTAQPPDELSEKHMTIGYVGVIGIQDGVDYLIRSFAELLKMRPNCNLRLVVVGYGPALEGLKVLSGQLGISHNVDFTGKVPFTEVPSLISSFDICATPDPSNPYNDSCTTIKTMEYMALEKPTVCFDTLENRRTAGDAAVYASENNTESYAQALAHLVDSPSLRCKLGKIGRDRIDDGLTWAHQAKNLVALYSDLFQRRDVQPVKSGEYESSALSGQSAEHVPKSEALAMPMGESQE